MFPCFSLTRFRQTPMRREPLGSLAAPENTTLSCQTTVLNNYAIVVANNLEEK